MANGKTQQKKIESKPAEKKLQKKKTKTFLQSEIDWQLVRLEKTRTNKE